MRAGARLLLYSSAEREGGERGKNRFRYQTNGNQLLTYVGVLSYSVQSFRRHLG